MGRLVRVAQWMALLGPLAAVLYVVLRYGVNIPYADQWDFVSFVVADDRGAVRWIDLWSPHNEHRMVVPKLLMLALAEATHWNIIVEMLVSVAFAFASLLLLFALARPTLCEAGPPLRLWATFTLSVYVFSLAQGTNWLWGWQIQWFLSVFAAILSIALATWSLQSPRPWLHIAGAAVAALVCQLSIASGVVVWAASALVLAFHPERRRVLVFWLVAATVFTAIYFVGYERPAGLPALAALEHPVALVLYLGNYLSGPLGRHAAVGVVVGTAFVVFAIVAARRHWRQPERFMPWVALGAFAGVNAVLTAIGRAGLGAVQGLNDRYVTIALLMSVALVPLSILAFRAGPSGRWTSLRPFAAVAGAALLTLSAIAVDIRSMADLAEFNRLMVNSRNCVLTVYAAPDICLKHLHPDLAVVRRATLQLEELGLTSFADKGGRGPTVSLAGPTGTRVWDLERIREDSGWVDRVERDGDALVIGGWARPPRPDMGSAPRVLLTVGKTIVAEAEVVGPSPGLAAHFVDPTLARSGWSVRVEGDRATSAGGLLRAYVVVSDGVLRRLASNVTVLPTR